MTFVAPWLKLLWIFLKEIAMLDMVFTHLSYDEIK